MDDKPVNVKISLQLLIQAIDLLEMWDVLLYDDYIQQVYKSVYFALCEKRERVDLRSAYARLISAKTEDERFEARMRYLQEKQSIDSHYCE